MNMDEDEVIRDYYVYLHKDPTTGVPFYVGKGRGKRAYDTERRHPTWYAKVESLHGHYDVEMVEQGLLEIDAFLSEAELIQKYGKISEGTGSLVNWTDGGESEMGSCGIGIEIPGMKEAYEKTNFVVIKGAERRRFADDLIECVERASERWEALYDGRDDSEDDDGGVEMFCLNPLPEDAEDFGQRKISCKDMAFAIDQAIEHLEGCEQTDFSVPSGYDVTRELLSELIVIRQRLGERRSQPKPMDEAEMLRTVKLLEETLEKLKGSQLGRGSEEH